MADGYAVLIVDNGGAKIKAGWSDAAGSDHLISNGIYRSQRDKRTYVADQLDTDCTDYGGLRNSLPCDRGILVNWDVEKVVWDRIFFDTLKIDPEQTSLLLTEPVLNLPNVQQSYDEIIFEEYEFASYLRSTAPFLAAQKGRCGVIVDSGFSFTHIVPVLFGEPQWYAVRRIDIGGKVLTNWMKELVSFRHWFMMDQTHLINHIKEKTCFLSTNLRHDLETSKASVRNANVRRYRLPDFNDPVDLFGEVLPLTDARTDKDFQNEQVLHLNNERFTVPEALFQPSLIGLKQMGIAEAIADSINAMPADLRGLCWDSILCIGGNVLLDNFHDRLFNDLRALAPSDYEIQVIVPEDPISHTLRSARDLLSQQESLDPGGIRTRFVSREEYAEHGSNLTRDRFGGPQYGTALYMRRALADVSDLDDGASSSSGEIIPWDQIPEGPEGDKLIAAAAARKAKKQGPTARKIPKSKKKERDEAAAFRTGGGSGRHKK